VFLVRALTLANYRTDTGSNCGYCTS